MVSLAHSEGRHDLLVEVLVNDRHLCSVYADNKIESTSEEMDRGIWGFDSEALKQRVIVPGRPGLFTAVFTVHSRSMFFNMAHILTNVP